MWPIIQEEVLSINNSSLEFISLGYLQIHLLSETSIHCILKSPSDSIF